MRRFSLLFFCVTLWFSASAGGAGAAPAGAAGQESAAVIQALRQLKTADATQRQKIYDLLANQGDASLIPALQAYENGQLLDGERLAIYGKRLDVPNKGSVLPLIDAVTAQPIKGADGQPIYVAKIDLANAIRMPPRRERGAINDLISSLSLLDPDPAARLQSIRDIGERAGRAFIDIPEQDRFAEQLKKVAETSKAAKPAAPAAAIAALEDSIADIDAATSARPADLLAPSPGEADVIKVKSVLTRLQGTWRELHLPGGIPQLLDTTLAATTKYLDRIDAQKKVLAELTKYPAALERQLDKDPNSRFAPAIKECLASIQIVTGDHAARLKAAATLGDIDTSRAENILGKVVAASSRIQDHELEAVARRSLSSAEWYQARIRFIQNTFAGLSAASILILLALGLSIIFGLMGVINMAHGEFMMIGAFTTWMISEAFKHLPAGAYDYYPIAAVPAAFIVAGVIGFIVEYLVVRHLYGRPLDSLLATWGIGLVLIQSARLLFGDNRSVKPPSWMEGGVEVAPDLFFPLNRVYIILFCVICIVTVHLLVNRTKLGLLLRATTQNREMAAALGVATRRVDGLTFAFGAGLAGLAGVAVPLYNKINPQVGQEYIVDSFMVVVTGGVGKLAGAVWAGLGLGFISKYLEPILASIPALASGASVVGKVIVLALVVVFLQWRPSGLFPPKGRMADA